MIADHFPRFVAEIRKSGNVVSLYAETAEAMDDDLEEHLQRTGWWDWVDIKKLDRAECVYRLDSEKGPRDES